MIWRRSFVWGPCWSTQQRQEIFCVVFSCFAEEYSELHLHLLEPLDCFNPQGVYSTGENKRVKRHLETVATRQTWRFEQSFSSFSFVTSSNLKEDFVCSESWPLYYSKLHDAAFLVSSEELSFACLRQAMSHSETLIQIVSPWCQSHWRTQKNDKRSLENNLPQHSCPTALWSSHNCCIVFFRKTFFSFLKLFACINVRFDICGTLWTVLL